MISFDMFHHQFTGPSGQLAISDRDEISLKLAMLIEGECGSGPTQAAAKFGFCRQRYFQLRAVFREKGARGLAGQKQGPKTNYRRTEELVSQVIRHRFLDVEASSEVITQKLKQCGFAISKRSVDRVLAQFGLQKKLYQYCPDRPLVGEIQSFRTRTLDRLEKADSASLEREVRQLLASKISGDMMGLWLLAPEHLRLGTWNLLSHWTGQPTPQAQSRLALQLVHEAALCVTGVRAARALSQKGFEVLNGLSFVAGDQAIHDLLEVHAVTEAERLQLELGWLRRARGHFQGQLLVIDPHRIRSYTQRQMCLYRGEEKVKPFKTMQTFFCLDADTHQPLCFTSGSAALSVTQATPPLLRLTAAILNPQTPRPLVLADTEHYTTQLFDQLATQTPFDLLVPMPQGKRMTHELQALPAQDFIRRWAGFATAKRSYRIHQSLTGPQVQFIQRLGETPQDYTFKAFLCSRDGDEVEDLALHFPKRWHIEEFFNANQALGWQRAGTMNLNIRYGQMTMALLAQAVIHQFRQRLSEPYTTWDAKHLAQAVFNGIDGDLRVVQDTILITFYNAPHAHLLRQHYENLPAKLSAEHIDPRIPWLFNFKLDFRFK